MPLRPVRYAPRVGSLVDANVRAAAPAGAAVVGVAAAPAGAVGVATAAEHALATKAMPTTRPAIEGNRELGRMIASPGSVSRGSCFEGPPSLRRGAQGGTGRRGPPVHLGHE